VWLCGYRISPLGSGEIAREASTHEARLEACDQRETENEEDHQVVDPRIDRSEGAGDLRGKTASGFNMGQRHIESPQKSRNAFCSCHFTNDISPGSWMF
jgi:hypothetical protein